MKQLPWATWELLSHHLKLRIVLISKDLKLYFGIIICLYIYSQRKMFKGKDSIVRIEFNLACV